MRSDDRPDGHRRHQRPPADPHHPRAREALSAHPPTPVDDTPRGEPPTPALAPTTRRGSAKGAGCEHPAARDRAAAACSCRSRGVSRPPARPAPRSGEPFERTTHEGALDASHAPRPEDPYAGDGSESRGRPASMDRTRGMGNSPDAFAADCTAVEARFPHRLDHRPPARPQPPVHVGQLARRCAVANTTRRGLRRVSMATENCTLLTFAQSEAEEVRDGRNRHRVAGRRHDCPGDHDPTAWYPVRGRTSVRRLGGSPIHSPTREGRSSATGSWRAASESTSGSTTWWRSGGIDARTFGRFRRRGQFDRLQACHGSPAPGGYRHQTGTVAGAAGHALLPRACRAVHLQPHKPSGEVADAGSLGHGRLPSTCSPEPGLTWRFGRDSRSGSRPT